TFAPSGRMSATVNIERPLGIAGVEGGAGPLDISVRGGGCTLKPVFFAYAMDDVRGQFRYRQGRLDLEQVTAPHGRSTITLDAGTVDLLPGGGYSARLNQLQAHSLSPDDALVKALPPVLSSGLTSIKLREPINLSTKLVATQSGEPGSPTALWWSGEVA